MLNKKFILTFVCLLASLFIYAESGTIGFLDSKNPHHEYYFNNNGKQNRYRIQMRYPHYAFYVDPEKGSYNECFPNFGMGISREEGEYSYQYPLYSLLSIFPEIIIEDEDLKDVFSIKGTSRDEAGYNYNCCATDWEIYEKGLVLDVLFAKGLWNADTPKKMKRVFLELKDDGKYHEARNAENFGKLRKHYSEFDFLDGGVLSYCSHYLYSGYGIYKMGSGKNIESVLISNILYYNKTDNGIEFITPYGCGFFDFKTESMSLVPKEKYLGKEFTYTPYTPRDLKLKEKKKIITEKDFVLPDINIPIRESLKEQFLRYKQSKMEQKEQDQLLKAELLAQ